METVRYEKSANPFKVGDVVRTKVGFGFRRYGRVVDLLSFEGSGLVFTDALVVCEDFNGTPWSHPFGYGALEAVAPLAQQPHPRAARHDQRDQQPAGEG